MRKLTKQLFSKIGCILLCASCVHLDKPTADLKKMLNDESVVDPKRINIDGAYHNNTKNRYYINRPIYFFKNGLLYAGNSSIPKESDVKLESAWLHKNLLDQKDWGVYKIIGDTIYAYTYYKFQDARAYFLLTNFRGTIKNSDTIIDWHMVPPLPKLNKSFQKEYSELINEHRTLSLKNVSYKPFMDSISEQVWINKYRIKK